MKPACVEFYKTFGLQSDGGKAYVDQDSDGGLFGWRLRAPAPNSQIILIPVETFVSHRNAVDSFKRICNALDARGPWEIKDLAGVNGSHAMLIA